MSILSDMNIWD